MDNRVSKSIAWIKVIVKEQRVDGSWYKKIFLYLRCTLLGFERNLLSESFLSKLAN